MNAPLYRVDDLAGAYTDARGYEIQLKHLQEDLQARKLALTPDLGWDGKNEEMRRTQAEKTFDADDVCRKIKADIRVLEFKLATKTGFIQAQEAYRRDAEWAIRARMVDAARGVLPSGTETNSADQPMDDMAQAQSELDVIAAFEQLAAAEIEDSPVMAFEDTWTDDLQF